MKEEKLLHLLKRKLRFFETILELSESELHLSSDDWISVLKQKKVLLAAVDKIDEELKIFKESWEMLSQEVVDEMECIKGVIEEILYIDKVNAVKRKKLLSSHEKE